MRIFIDIGHPAHVHYFRNLIEIMKNKGHTFIISARDKEVTHTLLKYFNLNYVSRGKGRKGLLGKIFYIFEGDLKIYSLAKKFQPDLFLSFGSTYAAHVSKLMQKPHIAFDDTEHAKYEHLLYVPFTDVILTPKCFNKHFGDKQLFFDSYMELSYLHPNYFSPKIKIKELLGIKSSEDYVILRFVSWGASHDIGQSGLSDRVKYKIIDLLQEKYSIFISSESALPENLQKYKLSVHPSELHSVLAHSSLYIGEGSTTASESSVLGIPNIYVNSLTVGYIQEQQKRYGLCIHLKKDDNLITSLKKIITNEKLKEEWKIKREKLLSDKIDLTAFMVWFVENYPKSYYIIKENPDYQYKFR